MIYVECFRAEQCKDIYLYINVTQMFIYIRTYSMEPKRYIGKEAHFNNLLLSLTHSIVIIMF